MNDGIGVTLMCRDLPPCRKEVNTGKAIERPVAQHLTQSAGPDFSRMFVGPTTKLGTPSGLKHLPYSGAVLRDGLHDFRLWSVRQAQGHLNFALELIRT